MPINRRKTNNNKNNTNNNDDDNDDDGIDDNADDDDDYDDDDDDDNDDGSGNFTACIQKITNSAGICMCLYAADLSSIAPPQKQGSIAPTLSSSMH